MKILSHRGYWHAAEEKNAKIAFERSFKLGFGTETDVRDLAGTLVISHDPPSGLDSLSLEKFLSWHSQYQSDLPLALNIKADGLAAPLNSLMKNRGPLDWFVFDMSIPDMRHHLAVGNPVFVRMSEYEQSPPWIDRAQGVWLDAFDRDWYTTKDIERILETGLRVCIVSPELHKRPHLDLWAQIKPLRNQDRLLLCTDVPEAARDFFS